MGFKRYMGLVAVGAACLSGSTAAMAAPPELLVVTRMPDPDPNFVPPPPEPGQKGQKPANSEQNEALEGAMQDVGRALGQAAMVQQQQIDSRCKAGEPATATAEQRFAWLASCRYSRH